MDAPRVTPAELGRELHVDPKAIRRFLRLVYGKRSEIDRRWDLDEEQVRAVRERFRVETSL